MLKRLAARFRGWRYGLRSKTGKDQAVSVRVGGVAKDLFPAAFNVRWVEELGITPKVLVNLGSYDGGTALFLKRAYPEARVITVEADPSRFELCQSTLADEDIEIVHCAACDTDGDIDWFVAKIDGQVQAQGSMFRHSDMYREKFPHIKQADQAIKLKGRRFDTLMQELGVTDVDLLLMDIEGAEHNVIKTLGAITPKLIYLEWCRDYFKGSVESRATENLLAELGYKLILKKTSDRMYFRPSS